MVKLGRGPRRHPGLGRQEPVPLFPPGELPVFGPPPANMRRPMPPPRGLPPMPGNYAPPPPPLPRPHHPPPPPPHMRPPPPMHPLPPPPPPYPRRHGPLPHPPALRPLLQTPVMPPRPLPFMRGRGPLHMARGGGHMKRLGKSMKKNRNKKNKAKDPVKPDGEHYCETCDRGWDTPEKLAEHLESHVVCGLGGCGFRAHPKVVALHVKLQHQTGLFDKIISCQSQEDIEKWRDERKRKYPTKENIQRTREQKDEMEKRGERLVTNRNRINQKPQGQRNVRIPNKRKAKARNDEIELQLKKYRLAEKWEVLNLMKQHSLKESSDESSSEEGTQNIIEEATPHVENNNFSDDEWMADDSCSNVEPISFSSGLSALMSTYGSDSPSDEDEDGKENNHESQNVNPRKENSEKIQENLDLQRNLLNGISQKERSPEMEDLEPGEEPDEASSKVKVGLGGGSEEKNQFDNTISADLQEKPSKGPQKKRHLRKKNRNENKVQKKYQKPNRPIPKKRLTLLEKLLEKQVRRERNYILQCVRYVVEKNFFSKLEVTNL